MDTKSLIIKIATNLFQQKGYMDVGVNEILKACNITKGGLYYHFPNGKEELLITCLQLVDKAITIDMEDIFKRYLTTREATQALIEKLVADFDRDGTITGYTFSSMVSEIGSLPEPVVNTFSALYEKYQEIYSKKLVADGFSEETANSIALMITASIEGGIMLCLIKKTSVPLKIVSQELLKIIN